jgi:hypothetical protein
VGLSFAERTGAQFRHIEADLVEKLRFVVALRRRRSKSTDSAR